MTDGSVTPLLPVTSRAMYHPIRDVS
jgi:hypothetical protein